MFLKQYNYKPRSNSQSSGSDQTTTQQPQQPASPEQNTAALNGRRRSSVTDKFAGLTSHKRNSSDAAAEQKRTSFLEQKPGSQGVLGGMWQSFTKGTN